MFRTSVRRLYSTAIAKNPFKLSTLPNGLRVGTSNEPGHFSALGVYVGAGSRFEGDSLKGCTHIADRLAFKSTKNVTGKSMA